MYEIKKVYFIDIIYQLVVLLESKFASQPTVEALWKPV